MKHIKLFEEFLNESKNYTPPTYGDERDFLFEPAPFFMARPDYDEIMAYAQKKFRKDFDFGNDTNWIVTDMSKNGQQEYDNFLKDYPYTHGSTNFKYKGETFQILINPIDPFD